ncbi:hypothetical protein KR51_00004950 [Rubidibacter lacunae KORDI 51-2]|uniref:Uncharacterized protein n=1 Tax=Rubidibacter lacunae KORDI 51-2 TaxID=582515 RepID=U5DM74_9CHRO|nr:hypothetical protein KR51_00004950 [Rubidibacter lacunae KORDI 51-2]
MQMSLVAIDLDHPALLFQPSELGTACAVRGVAAGLTASSTCDSYGARPDCCQPTVGATE